MTIDPTARRLDRHLLWLVVGTAAFFGFMAWAEANGLPRGWIGPSFLVASLGLYAVIGIRSRTADPEEYYVAGRRVPAMHNGMAAAADWMSAASFISLAGGVYLFGFGGLPGQAGGLAYLVGWTGGFVLLGVLIAPQLRRLELYTVPDFFQLRFGGRAPRLIAAAAAVVCSFLYVVAQIYGIGLIASRLTGVQFEIGVLLGLGGVLLCSFLGGMKAITWTQVAQYVVILLAFLIPVSWLAWRQLGNPVAPLAYGSLIERITAAERRLADDPAERAVATEFARRAREYDARLADVATSLAQERAEAQRRLRVAGAPGADAAAWPLAQRALAMVPKTEDAAREQWTRARDDSARRAAALGGVAPHARVIRGADAGAVDADVRNNFLALVLSLALGTVGLPHLLTRFYTTPSAGAARASVAWALFFIALVYVSIPALATMVKFEVLTQLVGTPFDRLPAWIGQWAKVDPALVSVTDVNGDGLLQWGEMRLGADMIMLATPELGGLPYVVSGLVAAGGLAAAISTADSLLLTISNALVRDARSTPVAGGTGPAEPPGWAGRRVILTKFTLLGVALLAAAVASARPADILRLVTASFSLAASTIVPVLLLGLHWRVLNRFGAVCGMLGGFLVAVGYMVWHAPGVAAWWGGDTARLWFGIQPLSAAVFGVPTGFALAIMGSLLTQPFGRWRIAKRPRIPS